MEMADRFDMPVLSLVDTAGAYPGIGAEERGQAEAIARSTDACLQLGVPNVAVITGEGMSGGAIAITTASRVLMLEHAIYSVISPEGAASILWRDAGKAQEAATNMKITAQDMLRFGVIDEIIKEPVGGAHRDPAAIIAATGDAIAQALRRPAQLRPRRHPHPAAAEVPRDRPQARLMRRRCCCGRLARLSRFGTLAPKPHSRRSPPHRGFFGHRHQTKFAKAFKHLRHIHYRSDERRRNPQIGLRVHPLKDNDCSTASGQVAQNPDGSGCPVGVVVSRGAWA